MNRMINTNARGVVQNRNLRLDDSSRPACVQAAVALLEARMRSTKQMFVTRTELLGNNAVRLTIKQLGKDWTISVGFGDCNLSLVPYWFDDSEPSNVVVTHHTDLTSAFIKALAAVQRGGFSTLVYSTDPLQMSAVA